MGPALLSWAPLLLECLTFKASITLQCSLFRCPVPSKYTHFPRDITLYTSHYSLTLQYTVNITHIRRYSWSKAELLRSIQSWYYVNPKLISNLLICLRSEYSPDWNNINTTILNLQSLFIMYRRYCSPLSTTQALRIRWILILQYWIYDHYFYIISLFILSYVYNELWHNIK